MIRIREDPVTLRALAALRESERLQAGRDKERERRWKLQDERMAAAATALWEAEEAEAREKRREYQRGWRERNRDKVREYNRTYQQRTRARQALLKRLEEENRRPDIPSNARVARARRVK